MNKLSLKNLKVEGKKVLMRVDFNVPLSKDQTISDDNRILQALPSIKYILDKGGSIILMSHLGRPKGKKDPKLSLQPCADRLSELLDIPVFMCPDSIGKDAEEMAKALKPGQVILLENLRFYDAEVHPDKEPGFAKALASLADCYVDDAFGAAHRKHSSTYTVTKYFPKKSAMGFLLEKELLALEKVLHPKRPFYAIVGGAKVSSKLGILTSLIEKVDALFIGGAMAYTFLLSQKVPVGDSLVEENEIITCKNILQKAKELKIKIYLPSDTLAADEFSENANIKVFSTKTGFNPPWQGMDIGPKTYQVWTENMHDAATIFWNGPLGVFEKEAFSKGTFEIAKFLSTISAETIVGGGDSVAAIRKLKLENRFTHLSTGGGAALEYIEFENLPAIEALTDAIE